MASTSSRLTLALIEVTRMRPEAPEYQVFSTALVDQAERRASALGWDVVRRPADLGAEALLEQTAGADAVLIMGGEDIEPGRYGQAPGYRNEGVHRPVADEAQLRLVDRAAAEATPLLGVCRGHQVINVALGGTLIPDLHEGEHRREDVPIEQVLVAHDVLIAPESGLSVALGERDRVSVQSAHHQAVDRLGAGLRAVAWAPDGGIEAIEHETLPITGVQWHPEAPEAEQDDLDALLVGLEAQARRSAELSRVA